MVWHTINDKYYDAKLNGVDWPVVRTRYEPLLRAASDDAYWDVLDKMAGELRDSHTRVESPKQVAQQRAQESHSLGIAFMELSGKLVLTSVHPDSDAYWTGARAGMGIKSIDGQPALPFFQALAKTVRDSSTPWARLRGANRKILSGDVGTKSTMVFTRPDGSDITATQSRRRFRNVPEAIHRTLPSGYGYVRFSGFSESLRSTVLSAFESLKDTPGLIIDLRNNGGGSADMSRALLQTFFAEDQKGIKLITRTNRPISLMFVNVMELEPKLVGQKNKAYTKPLVVLTNANSASASEVFSSVLQDAGRAAIVGQRTCGCLLGYLGYADIPGGGQLAYSELGFERNNGKRVEGEGVKPDIEVELTAEDYTLNRDRVLEAAEAFLQRKIAAERVKG